MAMKGKEVVAYIRKGLVFSVSTSCRSARDHPFVLGVLVFLLLLYRSCPSLFAFLVSSSPILICTALLLGALLSYGEPNIPEVEEEHKKTHDIASLKATSVADDLIVERDESLRVQTHVESRREIDGMTVNEVALGERRAASGSHEGPHVSSTSMISEEEEDEGEEEEKEAEEEEEEKENDTFIVARPLVKEDKKEIHIEEKVTEDKEAHDQGLLDMREFSEEKVDEGVKVLEEHTAGCSTRDQHETEELKVKVSRSPSENLFDSSLGSPWQSIDHHEAPSDSDSDSDRAESSSPDASMADIIPMLDELHPLLDSEAHQPAHDHESGDGSADEVENQEDEEDEEGHDEKDDGAEVAVTWTADDQKNLMDLGTSELERNQRLESLIAKRRARKNPRLEAERNLIDLDSSDTAPMLEHLSHLLVQIPTVSAPRRNPFDLPYDSDETTGLPPIPGSAPSVLLPRRNPFDFPDNQVDESHSHAGEGSGRHEFLAASQRDMFFRRHESFTVGFSGESKQEARHSKLKPYFIPERTDSDDLGFARYQRQSSEMSDSKVISVPECDSVSSVTDQEDHKELIDQELHCEGERLFHTHHVAEAVEVDSHSSFAVDAVAAEQELSGRGADDDHGVDFNASDVIEETHQLADVFGAVEEEIEFNSPVLEPANLEVIEDKYDETSSTSSLEVDEKSFQISIGEEPGNWEHTRGDSLKSGVLEYTHQLNIAAESVNNSRLAGPLYDSSPSAIEKSLPDVATCDEALLFAGKEGLNSSSFLSSGMQAETSEVGSPSKPVKENAVSEDVDSVSASERKGEEYMSGSGGLWVASSDLCSVDENESRSREVSEIKEDDVIGRGYFRPHGDTSDPVAPVMPISASSQFMHHLSFASVETESNDDKLVDVKASLQPGVDEIIGATTANSEKSVLPDDSTSTVSEKAHESIIHPAADIVESQISILDLPTIPEEKLEDVKLEEESDIMINPTANIALTGLQMVGKPSFGLSDVEQELFFLQSKSLEETSVADNTNRPVLEAGHDTSSVSSPMVSFHGSSVTGLSLLEPAESTGISNLSEMKSELENKVHGDLADRGADIINNGQSKKDDGFLEKSSNLAEESEVMHTEVQEIKEIDESLLSELDAVGDFHVSELKSVQTGSRDLLMDRQTTMDSGVGSSLWPHGEDPELTVYNSKLHILDAFSVEDVDTAHEQLPKEASVQSVLESTLKKLITEKPEVVSSESIDADKASKVPDSELQCVEAKSVDDISSAFEQISEGNYDNFLPHDIREPEIPSSGMHVELMGPLSNMPVIEAKSLEDIDVALKQLADSTEVKLESSVEPTDWSTAVETTQKHMEPDILKDLRVKEADSEQVVTEPYSMEDVSLAFKEYRKEGIDESAFPEVGPLEILQAKSMGINSDLHVVEATSLKDIDDAFRQLCESDIKNFLNAIESNDESTKVEANERQLETGTVGDSKLTDTDLELLVLEAKSIEDSDSASEQVIKRGSDTSVIPEVGSSEIVPGGMHMKLIETYSELHVVEAKSLEDIHLAFKQNSDGSSGSTSGPRNIGDGSVEAEASKQLMEAELLDIRPTEDVPLTYQEAVPKEAGSSAEQSSEDYNEFQNVAGISHSNASTSRKIWKKDKSGKSSSSSSSSSSDSD